MRARDDDIPGLPSALTLMAVLALALGIGANTAIFSVMNAVILQPLPYRDPDRLVLVQELIPKTGPGPIPVSAPDVVDFTQQNHVFEGIAGFQGLQFELAGAGTPAQIQAVRDGSYIRSPKPSENLFGSHSAYFRRDGQETLVVCASS